MAHPIKLNGKFPAWRDEGVYEGSFNTPLEATVNAGLNYRSATVPLFAVMPDGSTVEVPERALFRGVTPNDPERRFIATVSPRYTPVQHTEVAEALANIPKDWPLSMIGKTGKHDTHVFWGFDAGTRDLLGKSSEQIQQHVYIDNCNDGGSSLHLMGTITRMPCLNMFPLAMKNASFYVRLRHGSQALVDVQQWTKYFHRVQHGMDIEISNLERMASVKAAREQVIEALERVYETPMPQLVKEHGEVPKPGLPDQVLRAQNQYAQLLERTEVYRIAALEQFDKINDTDHAIAGTVYAAFNGVTFLENWRQSKGDGSSVESALYGERAKAMQKAHDVFMALT